MEALDCRRMMGRCANRVGISAMVERPDQTYALQEITSFYARDKFGVAEATHKKMTLAREKKVEVLGLRRR